jgi:hypothetical protein
MLARAILRRPPRSALPRYFHASPVSFDEEKPASSSSFAFLQDSRVQFPIAFLLAIPAVQMQWFVLNEETQLLGCFMVFVGTVYSQAGDAIGSALDAKGESVISEHNAQERVTINAAKSVVEAHKSKLSLVEDMKMIHGAQAELLASLSAAKSMELQFQCRADIVKKLDYLVMKEEAASVEVQGKLVSNAATAVTAEFAGSKDLQAKALTEALDTIADPSSTAATDVVGGLFTKYFHGYKQAVRGSTGEVDIPSDVLAAAADEIISLRKKNGDDNGDVSGFPTKYSLA